MKIIGLIEMYFTTAYCIRRKQTTFREATTDGFPTK